jgi:multicomponent Na+:H+ antiporter subunit B
MVTAILAGYRGYDTMGEVVVIFAAGLGVLSLLGIWMGKTTDVLKSKNIHMRQHLVLRVLTKILIPPILLFALYVQFHGDYSPGGGFQAGVIFAAGFILYSLIYGLNMTFKIVSTKLLRNGMALGVLIFGGVGVAALCLGGNFLDYSVLHDNPLTGQMIGIMLVELGVGVTVACVMMSIFFNFSKRSAALEDEDQPL